MIKPSELLKKITRWLFGDGRLIKYYWRRTSKNKLAIAGLGFVLFLILLAIIGPFFTLDPTMSNFEQNNLPPVGFSTESSTYDIATAKLTAQKIDGVWSHPSGNR